MIFEIIAASLAAVLIYTIIGFVPGTDETSVLLPITLMLVLSGASEVIILSFFINWTFKNCFIYYEDNSTTI